MNGGFGVWEEIQSEQRSDAAVPPGPAREASNSSGDEGYPRIPGMFSSEFDERGGWIAAYDRRRVGVAADRLGKRPRAAPDIQPANAARDLQPGHEPRGEAAAPAAHEVLVR
jgi:hypothetical protein